MTCVAGFVHKGQVYLGADSAGVSNWNLTIRKDPKVFRLGRFVFGFTSSFRMGQALQYSFTPPKLAPDVTPALLDSYMRAEFIDGIRTALKHAGWATIKGGTQEEGGDFLVGVDGRLFHISSDYQVGEALDSFDACGCGAEAALGALYATEGASDPVQRLLTVLRASERLCIGVRGPFHWVVTP